VNTKVAKLLEDGTLEVISIVVANTVCKSIMSQFL